MADPTPTITKKNTSVASSKPTSRIYYNSSGQRNGVNAGAGNTSKATGGGPRAGKEEVPVPEDMEYDAKITAALSRVLKLREDRTSGG